MAPPYCDGVFSPSEGAKKSNALCSAGKMEISCCCEGRHSFLLVEEVWESLIRSHEDKDGQVPYAQQAHCPQKDLKILNMMSGDMCVHIMMGFSFFDISRLD